MPEAGPSSIGNKLSLNGQESSVIVVTSLRLKRRPLSLRQQRLAEFRSSEARRKRPKEVSERTKLKNRKAIRDQVAGACTAEASVTALTTGQIWINQNLAMDHTKEEKYDDVKVLYPARDLLYSDSEVAILSCCSSWCAGPVGTQDADPKERFSTVDEVVPPRPCGRVGILDGSSGVGDRYLNKPPGGVMPNEGTERNMQKPYRQVWHSLWDHNVGRDSVASSNSAKRTKHVSRWVSGREGLSEPITASVNNIDTELFKERKQRRGVFHQVEPMTQTRVTYRSKTVTRTGARAFYQRAPSTGIRVAQRKVSLLKDGCLEDSERIDRRPKSRRCELSERKNIPRAVVKTASRLGTVVLATEKENSSPPTDQKSLSPPTPKRGAMGSPSNRSWHCKPIKSASKTRFSVPSEPSRVAVDTNFKETISKKPILSRRDPDVSGRLRSVKYRGLPIRVQNTKDRPLSDLNQMRDARMSVHFNPHERSCSPSLANGRRLYSPPLYKRADLNSFDADPDCGSPVDTGGERNPISNDLVSDAAPRLGLKSKPASRLSERGACLKSTSNVPIANHFCCYPIIARQYAAKSRPIVHPSYRTPPTGTAMPPRFSCDVAASPDALYDGHSVSDQVPTAFRFSHPNAPDVLISPPPNPQFLDTLCGPSQVSNGESSPIPMYNPCVQQLNMPRYCSFCTPETSVEDNYAQLQPSFQQNVPFRAFMPSIDFSRFEPPPRPLSGTFRGSREGSVHRQPGFDENSPFMGNEQQVEIPTTPCLILAQNEKTPKPSFLTFGAQVPSSSHIPLKSCPSKVLSSPLLEMQGTNVSYPHDAMKSNLTNASLENPANVPIADGLASNDIEPILKPLQSQNRTNEYSLCVDKVSTIIENDDTDRSLQQDESPLESAKPKVTDPVIEVPQRSDFPLKESVSVGRSRADPFFESRQFESAELRPVLRNMISRSLSGTKRSTTRGSADVLLSGGGLADVSDCEFNTPYASNSPNMYSLDKQTGRRFQRMGGTMEQSVKYNSFEITGNQEVFAYSDVLANTGNEPNPSSEERVKKDASPVTGYIRRFSGTTPSDRRSVTYPVVSADQQITAKEKSLYPGMEITAKEKDRAVSRDGDLKNRVATELYSMNTSSSIRRFQSLVARLDNIALQCKLSGHTRPIQHNFSNSANPPKSSQTVNASQAEKIECRDAYVQVPVLCSQCVETEPFTAEKGIPDGRVGLCLKLTSTVVDVPPVLKTTQSVGTNTSFKSSEDDPSYTEGGISVYCSTTKRDSDSKFTLSDQSCSTSALNVGSLLSDEGRQSVLPVQAPVMKNQSVRLKPFFRSHRSELTNVYKLAAAHSITLDTDKCRSYVVSREEKPRTDSNTSTEIRKDKRTGTWDDERKYQYEHEQPGRFPKQHAGERRVSFRPFRRETDIICPSDESQDERSEHHRTPHGKVSVQNDEICPQVAFTSAKELRKLKRTEKLNEAVDIDDIETESSSRTTDFVNVVDVLYAGSGRKNGRCVSRGNSAELSELSRPLYENLNADKVIALMRKPGCALCKKDPSPKKGILKIGTDARGKNKPPDVPGSILRFGLSSIVTPVNVDSKEEIVITTATISGEMSEVRSPKSRKTVKPLQKSIATVVALEASRKTEPVKSNKLDFKDGRSTALIRDSLEIQNLSKECGNQNVDHYLSVNDPIGTDESIVPVLCFTKPETKDVPNVKGSSTPLFTVPVQSDFTAVKPTSGEIKDSGASNSFVDHPSKDSALIRVDCRSKAMEVVPSIQSMVARNDIFSEPVNRTTDNACRVKVIAVHYDSKESNDLRKNSPVNPEKTVQNDTIKSSDSAQLRGGCMFTAMRRFMKNRPRSQSNAPWSSQHADCVNGYPGFQYTGVPAFESECLPLESFGHYNQCKCKHMDIQDCFPTSSPEDSPPTCKLCRRRSPIRCTSPSRFQKCTAIDCDVRDLTDDTERDEDIEDCICQFNRGQKFCHAKNHLRQSASHRRRESKQLSPRMSDPYATEEAKSGSSELLISTAVHKANFCSHDRLCPESQPFSNPLLTCSICNKKDCEHKPPLGIRTLPPDMVSDEAFEMSFPRCRSALPKGSVSSGRSSTRSSSAPAGQVRVVLGRCWPPSRGPRRLVPKHVKLLECDNFTCERCDHRKARQRTSSWMYDDKQLLRKKDHLFLVIEDRHDDLNDASTIQCSCTCRKDYGV